MKIRDSRPANRMAKVDELKAQVERYRGIAERAYDDRTAELLNDVIADLLGEIEALEAAGRAMRGDRRGPGG